MKPTKSFKYCEKSAENEFMNTQSQFYNCYNKEFEIETDNKIKVYKEAKNDGLVKLGYCYQKGIGIEIDKVKAFNLYKEAAENDSLDAKVKLGYCYQKGIGIDKVKAFNLYKEAAENDSLDAKVKLGYCFQKGIGIEIDKVKAFNLFKESAENKNNIAQYNLGQCYRFRIGVEKDETKALSYIKKQLKKRIVQLKIFLEYYMKKELEQKKI